MLLSLGILFLMGILIRKLFKKMKLPSLIGYLLLGILLGPSVLDLLSDNLLNISNELRQIILIIILTRAGLSLDINDLKKIGKPAILLSFVPATFEIITVTFLGIFFLNIPLFDAALLGAVLGAVSPAVIAPRMIQLIEKKRGTKNGVPQLVLAGSSMDDIYALVLFTTFLSLAQSSSFKTLSLLEIPVSIGSGIIMGLFLGHLLSYIFKKIEIEKSTQFLILLALSFMIVSLEDILPFSGILAVMSIAIKIRSENLEVSTNLSHIYNELWKIGEVLLFVLVGASVSIGYALKQGVMPVMIILIALLGRMLGVLISLYKSNLNKEEKLFVLISYTPKATVQAAIGGIPLAVGLDSGPLILTVSVVAILITAPLGAIGIDRTYERLLSLDKKDIL